MDRSENMASEPENEQIIHYLLDEMKDDERFHIEERFVHEPSFYETVAATEDELIMSYVREDLKGETLSRFIEVYMESPARRARVESARALRNAVQKAKASRESRQKKFGWFRPLMVATTAVAAIALFLLWASWRSPRPLGEQETSLSVSFSLEPGLTRSGEGAQFFISNQAKEVRFQLEFAGSHPNESYRVVLSRPEQQKPWQGMASWTAKGVVVSIPAADLPRGDYTLDLQAANNTKWEEVETYYFRILR